MDLQCSHFFLNVYFMWNMFSKWGNQIFFACSFPHWFWYCNAWQKKSFWNDFTQRWNCQFRFSQGCVAFQIVMKFIQRLRDLLRWFPTYSIYFHLFIVSFRSGHMFVSWAAVLQKALLFNSLRYKDTGGGTHPNTCTDARAHKHTRYWSHLTCHCAISSLCNYCSIEHSTPQFPPVFIHHIIRSNYC